MLIYEIPYEPINVMRGDGTHGIRNQLVLIVDNGYNPGDESYTPTMVIVNYTEKRWYYIGNSHLDDVVTNIANGRKVSAIKLVRDLTKLGLFEAKQIVDYIAENTIRDLVPIEIKVEKFFFK